MCIEAVVKPLIIIIIIKFVDKPYVRSAYRGGTNKKMCIAFVQLGWKHEALGQYFDIF